LDSTDPKPRTGRWLLACGVVCAVAAAWIAQVPLGGVPHVSDEVAYTLQARLFAALQRVGPAPDNASMWVMPFWNVEGGMYSPFPLGWPALLAPFEAMGLSAWLNPLLAGFLPWAVYRIAATRAGLAVARTSALIVAFSPGVWLLAGSRMSHTSVLLALGILMFTCIEGKPNKLPWFVGGLAAAYVVLARPFDGLLLAGPLLALGTRGAGDARMRLTWIGLPALAVIIVAADNYTLTGDALRFPMSAWFDQWQGRVGCNQLGFGPDIGCAPTFGTMGHTPVKAGRLMLESAIRFDGLLLGVHGGGLLALWGAWRMRARWGLVWVALVILGYGFYWSPGRAYGARFWHPLYLVMPIGMAVALVHVRRGFRVIVVAALAVLGLSRVAPDLADRFWCVDGGLAAQLEAVEVTEAVVFLQGDGVRSTSWPMLGVDVFQCDPMLEAGDGWILADPTRMQGGIQFRHALPDLEQTRVFMAEHHPGSTAWLAIHDVAADQRVLRHLGVLAGH
jgi:hypothetical protein